MTREDIDKEIYKDVFRDKECFRPIHAYLKNISNRSLKLIDIGCAAGEFLWSVQNANFENINLFGIDPVEALIKRAKVNAPDCQFKVGDIDSNPFSFKFDVVSLQGVLPIFNELDNKIDALFDFLALNDTCYIIIFNNSNPFPIDVKMEPVKYGENESGKPLIGYNIWSNQHIVDALERAGQDRNCTVNVTVEPFQMHSNIPFNGDPLRAWTIELADRSLMQIRGLNTIQNQHFFFAEINKRRD